LTRERIRQIEARAMSKLRHPTLDGGARELITG
jgi:DNA-directed RNA polymerase sigma subunit (sigma70/sigma32)